MRSRSSTTTTRKRALLHADRDRARALASASPRATFKSDPPSNELQGSRYASCDCFAALNKNATRWSELKFHDDTTSTRAAEQLAELIKVTADKGLTVLAPRRHLGWELWAQVTRLPPTIQFLTSVETLDLYGSHLVSIPPEVASMTRLQYFDPYTSYRLHWPRAHAKPNQHARALRQLQVPAAVSTTAKRGGGAVPLLRLRWRD